jgi:hypothetical protein
MSFQPFLSCRLQKSMGCKNLLHNEGKKIHDHNQAQPNQHPTYPDEEGVLSVAEFEAICEAPRRFKTAYLRPVALIV